MLGARRRLGGGSEGAGRGGMTVATTSAECSSDILARGGPVPSVGRWRPSRRLGALSRLSRLCDETSSAVSPSNTRIGLCFAVMNCAATVLQSGCANKIAGNNILRPSAWVSGAILRQPTSALVDIENSYLNISPAVPVVPKAVHSFLEPPRFARSRCRRCKPIHTPARALRIPRSLRVVIVVAPASPLLRRSETRSRLGSAGGDLGR